MTTQKEKITLKKKTLKTLKGKKPFMDEMKKRLPSADCENVWKDAHKRLYRMYLEHMNLPKGVVTHTDSFIFPAAAAVVMSAAAVSAVPAESGTEESGAEAQEVSINVIGSSTCSKVKDALVFISTYLLVKRTSLFLCHDTL